MIGLKGLHKASPRRFRTPRAPRYLLQKLEGPLRRPRISRGQAEIGINHADKSERWEMMPLCDELRANDDLEFALRNGIEFAP